MRTFISFIFMALALSEVCAQNEQTVITFRAGDCTVNVLSEGGNQGKASLLKGATPEQLQKYLPDGVFPLQTQAFLVCTPEHNVLIDAGHGRNLFANLETIGFDDLSVDVILLTHMHGDHIGGLLIDGKAAFPKAKLYVSKAEHDYWNKQGERGAAQRKIFEVYKSKLRLFEPVSIENADKAPDIVKGISALAVYGHTPGHTAFRLLSDDAKWIIWGDLTHAMPVQMPCPEVAMSFDVDADKAVTSRKKLLEYITEQGFTAGGMHVPFPAVGSLKKQDGGYVFTPLCLCEGL